MSFSLNASHLQSADSAADAPIDQSRVWTSGTRLSIGIAIGKVDPVMTKRTQPAGTFSLFRGKCLQITMGGCLVQWQTDGKPMLKCAHLDRVQVKWAPKFIVYRSDDQPKRP